MKGIYENVTVIKEADSRYASVQCEFELNNQVTVPDFNTAVGIDTGVKRFLTLSIGHCIESSDAGLKEPDDNIGLLQRRIKHKVKGSDNIKNRRCCIREKLTSGMIFLHQVSASPVKNRDVTVIEDLKVRNMSRSARGTKENPGKNVKAESGLKLSVLKAVRHKFFTYPEYKLRLKGGRLIKVNPEHTGQACPQCGHISKDARRKQAVFGCVKCGCTADADENAALNILRRAGPARPVRRSS